jgi:hypothetical protein
MREKTVSGNRQRVTGNKERSPVPCNPSPVNHPLDLSRVKTYPIKERQNLVSESQFARPIPPIKDFSNFLDSLPKLLASEGLKQVVEAVVSAHKEERQVVMALGAHVVKCGLSPIIIDLMERGIVTALAMNGATAIHDYEVALIGATSEDVKAGLEDGSFGMVRETAQAFQSAAGKAVKEGMGLGKALGRLINEERGAFARYSLLGMADRLNLPATVHVVMGADTVHMHPNVSGKDMGEATLQDFRLLAGVVAQLEGGVWFNVGSAVVLPEVFLKALSLARNLGHKVKDFATVNLDMQAHYRPTANVVQRPTKQGYTLIGHHEIMLPLLRMGILARLE